MLIQSSPPGVFADRFASAWARTDALFRLVAPDAMLARPIALRHPFIFYVGHLPAFAWNHVCAGTLGRASFNPEFDDVFSRGSTPTWTTRSGVTTIPRRRSAGPTSPPCSRTAIACGLR